MPCRSAGPLVSRPPADLPAPRPPRPAPPAPALALAQQPQWVPLSVVKGGAAANMLVKGLGTDLMRETTVKTLVQVGAARWQVQLLVASAAALAAQAALQVLRRCWCFWGRTRRVHGAARLLFLCALLCALSSLIQFNKFHRTSARR